MGALVFAADLPQRRHLDRVRGSGPAAHDVREVLDVNVRTGSEDARPFDGVLELAHIPGPGVAEDLLEGARGVAADRPLQARGRAREKRRRERPPILGPFTQRRITDR